MLPKSIYCNCEEKYHKAYIPLFRGPSNNIVEGDTWPRYKSRIVIYPMEVNPVTSKDVFRYCWYSSLTLDLKVPIEGTCCHHGPMNNNRNDNCYNDLFRNFRMTFLDSPDDLIWCVRLNRYRDVLRFTLESSWYIQVSNRMRWLGIDIKFSTKSGGIIRPT